MEYRDLHYGEGKVSTIGIGVGGLSEASPRLVISHNAPVNGCIFAY